MNGEEVRTAGDKSADYQGTRLVQVGWMNPATGVQCDCPVYEVSPHANSVPIYKEATRG